MGAPDQNRDDDDDADVVRSDAAALPTAVVVEPPPEPPDPMRWIRRGGFLAALVIGWTFILWQNKFNPSAPAIFVCLGYLAIVSTIYALWRTGVVAVAEDAEENDSTWGRPIGRRAELDREKKTLLKAIKECEFDREMGKLSKADSDEMIAVYRLRAIEVIKEIEHLETGAAGSVRAQIERELKARLEIDAKAEKAKADAMADAAKDKKSKDKGKKKPPAKAAAEAAIAAAKADAAPEKANAASELSSTSPAEAAPDTTAESAKEATS